MKKAVLLGLIALIISFNVKSQESKTDAQHYRVFAIIFKHNMADEGTKRGMNLFHKSRAMLGLTTLVFKSESGPYDLLVFTPVSANNPFEDNEGPEIYKAMVKIMGSEDALKKEFDSWSNLVDRQETFYFKSIMN